MHGTNPVFAVFLLLLLLPFSVADTGPKPSMDFSFSYNTSSNISIINGEQYQCEDEACAIIKPLGQYGPQRFTCADGSCSSMAYGYSDYQKLIINFTDKSRASNVFKTDFPGYYAVLVTDDGLVVKSSTAIQSNAPPGAPGNYGTAQNLPASVAAATLITIIAELIVASAYLRLTKKQKRILLSVLIANIISVPIVWLVALSFRGLGALMLVEVLAVVSEACFIRLANKKQISLKESFTLSILMNVASFAIGWLIMPAL